MENAVRDRSFAVSDAGGRAHLRRTRAQRASRRGAEVAG